MRFVIAVKRAWAWFMQPAPEVDAIEEESWWNAIR